MKLQLSRSVSTAVYTAAGLHICFVSNICKADNDIIYRAYSVCIDPAISYLKAKRACEFVCKDESAAMGMRSPACRRWSDFVEQELEIRMNKEMLRRLQNN